MSYEINGKRLELLQEAFPQVTHVGVLSNPMHPGEYGELKVTEAAAEKLGLKLSYGRIVSAADVERAFNLVRAKGADAIDVLPDGAIMQHTEKFLALAAQQHFGFRIEVSKRPTGIEREKTVRGFFQNIPHRPG